MNFILALDNVKSHPLMLLQVVLFHQSLCVEEALESLRES